MYSVDSNGNLVVTQELPERGCVVARLLETPQKGYVCRLPEVGDTDFGNEACPSSPAVTCWFGPGERIDTAWNAIEAYFPVSATRSR